MREKKYISISDGIESAISDKKFTGRLPGLVKLAEIYKSNPRTISKALGLLEEKGIVTVNGTRGTYVSGNKQRPRFRVIGVIGLRTQFLSHELEAIKKVASEERYRVIALSDNSDLDELLRENAKFLVNFPADAFIFAHSSITENIAATLRGAGIPFAAMNYVPAIQGINWVGFDAEQAFKQVLDNFKVKGHRQIAYFGFKNNHYNYSQRIYKIYYDFMTQINGWNERFYYCPCTLNEYYAKHGENSYQDFAQEIVEYILALKNRPTAIYIAPPYSAISACKLLKKAGLDIPNDLSIAGEFDLLNRCDISGILFDYNKRARGVAEIVTGLLKNENTPLTQKTLKSQWNPGKTIVKVHEQ